MFAVAVANEPAVSTREQHTDLFENLANRRRGDLVAPCRVFGVHCAAGEDVRAWREVRAAWSPHEQQLPRLAAAHEQHGR